VSEDTTSSGTRSSVATNLRTFLIADVRGYTRFTQDSGDEAASALASRFAVIVRDTVPGFDGELLELRGDEALCVFGSARQALQSAIELQRRFRGSMPGVPALPLGVGMGLDAGEAVPTEGGYRGGALNLAARLCARAAPGEVWASETVVHLARRLEGIRFATPRSVRFKGLSQPVRVVQVTSELPLPPLPPPPASPRRRIRPVVGALAAIAAGVGVALAVALMARGGGGGRAAVSVVSNSLVVINPAAHRVVADIPVGSGPGAVAFGYNAAWVANTGDNTVTRIDPKTYRTRLVGVPVVPANLTIADGSVLAYDGSAGRGVAIDPQLRQLQPFKVPSPPCLGIAGPQCFGAGMTYGGGALWVAAADQTVWKLSPSGLHTTGRIPHVYSDALTWGLGRLWAYGVGGSRVVQIDPHARRVTHTYAIVAGGNSFNNPEIVTAAGSAWAISPAGLVYVLSVAGEIEQTIRLGPGLLGAAVSAHSIWITSTNGTLYQVALYNKTIEHTYHFHHQLVRVAVGAHRIWATVGT
jgi:YVTN family beta-propeller protein